MKQSALYFSVAMLAVLQTGLSKADEVFLPQANMGRLTTLLSQVSPAIASKSAATMVATPVSAAAVASPANVTSAPKQNVSQLSQVGTNNNALVNQVGSGNISMLSQQGHGNVAVVNQTSRSR